MMLEAATSVKQVGVLHNSLHRSNPTATIKKLLVDLVYTPLCIRRVTPMGGEILNAALLSFGLIFVGWGLGALLLKIQGTEE